MMLWLQAAYHEARVCFPDAGCGAWHDDSNGRRCRQPAGRWFSGEGGARLCRDGSVLCHGRAILYGGGPVLHDGWAILHDGCPRRGRRGNGDG